MTLAGLGQCGILVRARLRLTPAPASITVQPMRYEDLTALLEDLRRLAADESLATIAGEITRGADGGWRRSVLVGTTAPASSDARASWKAGLRLAAADAPTTSSYWEYLDRRTASVAAGRSRGEANPSLAVAVPFDAAAALLTHVLSDPPAAQGIWRIEVLPLVTARFTQPLFKVPDGRGKVYPPYAPVLSADGWREHYGTSTWDRLAAAKRRHDPNTILTPGAGVFG